MRPADLRRRLKRLATKRGWDYSENEGREHTKVHLNGRPTVVGRHPEDLRKGTFYKILKDLGLSEKDLEDWSMHYAYPVTLQREDDGTGFTAFFEGLPGATGGATDTEALARAEDLLVTALSLYVEDGKPLPRPPEARGRMTVAVPALDAAKLALHDAMLAQGISNVELGRRMGRDEKAIRRLRDPVYRSHIGQVEAALHVLGKRVELVVMDAA
jgi:antitoxin HicB